MYQKVLRASLCSNLKPVKALTYSKFDSFATSVKTSLPFYLTNTAF